ncbi:MAG TPA: HAMP domain-containing sensor histidine kinase [Frankiaceae bacterium]|nr:HAMP domain-containing sensor histidine kinase [Frankiaceae bacterium]
MAVPPPAPVKRRTGLASRLAIATTAVAALAVLVSGLVSLGLLRGASQTEARQQLSRQADGYVLIVDRAVRGARFQQLKNVLAQQQTVLEAINASGQACGANAIQLPTDVAGKIVSGRSVSAVARAGGARRIIEGRARSPDQAGAVLGGCRAVGIALLQKASQAKVLADPLRNRLLIALAIGLVGAAVAGILLARRLARPLQHAAAAARALAGGRRDVEIRPEGPAEVAEVADALNGLAAALARSEGRQRDFLLSISHELRTPLTAVSGHAEALADGVITGEDTRAAGTVMLSEAHRLNRLVSDLLDLARLGADDFRIDLAATDLAALVRGAEQVWRPRCASEGIELRLELPPTPLVIVTDGGRVRQILDGLAENALRVVPQGAPIIFAVGPDPLYPGFALLQVRDGGPGLTPEDCAVAFERSTLYERYRGIRRVGTGLGLALVAGLAGALGGSAAAGRAPEGGAAFTIRLPYGSR